MSASIVDKWERLAAKLMALTESGSINWSGEIDDYSTRVNERTITVEKLIDSKGVIKIVFSIYAEIDGELKRVDTFDDDDLPFTDYEDLKEFLNRIHRKATGADEALDDLLGDLDDLASKSSIDDL